MTQWYLVLAVLCSALIALSGCGGSGGSSSLATRGRTVISVDIGWGARSRSINGPGSALSATITIANNAHAPATSFTVDRPAGTAAVVQNYSSTQTIPAGNKVLTIVFYTSAGGTGDVVASASLAVKLNNNGTLTNTDGSPLGTIFATGTITSVQVLPNQTAGFGTQTQLLAQAFNAQSQQIAISAGSIFWNVASGASNLSITQDGIATGLAIGPATVVATVDGVASAAQDVTITPGVSVVNLPVNDIAYDPISGKIWATVQASGGAYANSIVSIDPLTGAIGTPIPLGLEPNRIAVTSDGQFAYATVDADLSVRQVNIANNTVGNTYFVNPATTIVDLITIPGSPNSFVTATDPNFGVNVKVYDNGVARSGTGAGGSFIQFAGSDPTTIYGWGNGALVKDILSPTAITWVDQTNGLVDSPFAFYNGLLYASSCNIYDPVAKTLVGNFPQGDLQSDRQVAVSGADNRVYIVTWGTDKIMLTFDLAARTEFAPFDTGALPGGANRLISCGSHTAAFYIFGPDVTHQVVIVKGLP